MSRSTTAVEDPRTATYYQALLQLDRLVRGGASWSGHERNVCLLNTADGSFADFSSASGFDLLDDARAIGVVDWDGDGDQDLWIKNHSAPQLRFLENRWPGGGHYCAVRLTGQRSNRDGIGARVEVDLGDGRAPLVRSLRAGEGYSSQASKWIHLGLGGRTDPVQLTIFWPSGTIDEIADLAVDRRYTVDEGSGRAVPWTTGDDSRGLTALPLPAEPPRPATEQNVAFPAPLPDLRFRDSGGEVQSVRAAGRPLWIQLWASWCQPCLEELQATARAAEPLRQSSLDVLALNLETAGPDPAVELRPGADVLEQLGWSAGAGWALPSVVEKLELWSRTSYYFDRPLALPASLLVDADNRLVAVYRGAVGPELVLARAAQLGAQAELAGPRGLPFAGRWQEPPGRGAWLDLAGAFRQAGYRPDARRYYEAALAIPATGPRADLENQSARAALVDLTWQDALDEFGIGHIEQAETLLLRVLEMQPDHAEARYRLGRLAAHVHDHEAARQHYRAALALEPKHVGAMASLGLSLLQDNQVDEAFAWFRQVLAVTPQFPEIQAAIAWTLATHADPDRRNARDAVMIAEHLCQSTQYRHYPYLDLLAAAYAEQGDFARAVELADQAAELAAAAESAQQAAAIRERAQRYREGQPYRQPAAGAAAAP